MDERKKRIARFFAIIYLFFGASIIYLLYFNTGIELSGTPNQATGGLDITVKNSSIHLIRDLNVSIVDENNSESNILSLAELKPGEERKMPISEIHSIQGFIIIKAQATYHQPVMKKISVEGIQGNASEFKAELSGPSKTFLNTLTKFSVLVCVLGNEEESIEISEEFSKTYFAGEIEKKNLSLKSNECKSEEFTLMPSGKGKTTIAFNITTETVNKRLEKEIEIIE